MRRHPTLSGPPSNFVKRRGHPPFGQGGAGAAIVLLRASPASASRSCRTSNAHHPPQVLPRVCGAPMARGADSAVVFPLSLPEADEDAALDALALFDFDANDEAAMLPEAPDWGDSGRAAGGPLTFDAPLLPQPAASWSAAGAEEARAEKDATGGTPAPPPPALLLFASASRALRTSASRIDRCFSCVRWSSRYQS